MLYLFYFVPLFEFQFCDTASKSFISLPSPSKETTFPFIEKITVQLLSLSLNKKSLYSDNLNTHISWKFSTHPHKSCPHKVFPLIFPQLVSVWMKITAG